jgi:hypothetical protein
MRRLAAVSLAALAFAAGCGDDDGNGDGGGNGNGDDNGAEQNGGGEDYPQAAIDNFLESCTAQPGASDSECECAIDEIQAEIPFEEFKEVDEALRENRDPPGDSQERINDAVRQCRE